jgi:superfamily II DNA helicase RecQ
MPIPSFPVRTERFQLKVFRRNNFIDACINDTLDSESEILSGLIRDKYGFSPRQWQSLAIQHVRHGRDCLIKAGTSSGKSLCFQALALTKDHAVVLVIVPTLSVMMDQVILAHLTLAEFRRLKS